MVTTIVVWDYEQPTSVEYEQIVVFLESLIQQGKTNGDLEKYPDPEDADRSISKRTWIDLESAESWINFINQFSPVSATIESDDQ